MGSYTDDEEGLKPGPGVWVLKRVQAQSHQNFKFIFAPLSSLSLGRAEEVKQFPEWGKMGVWVLDRGVFGINISTGIA